MVQIHFIEVASLLDFARYVCAFREYPLRVYSHELHGKKVLSTRTVLSSSILAFYTSYENGRYIEYDPKNGKETAKVVDAIQSNAQHAPIVHLLSLPFQVKNYKKISDKFKTSKVLDLGSLARITYDPEWPDDPKVTLLCFPYRKKWIIGYMSMIELDDTTYCLYYVELDEEPGKPFIKYSGHKGESVQFTDVFQHGFPYLPIVKLKKIHPIFGLK